MELKKANKLLLKSESKRVLSLTKHPRVLKTGGHQNAGKPMAMRVLASENFLLYI